MTSVLGSISANAYFNHLETTPQPISVAPIAPSPPQIRYESSSSIAGNVTNLVVPAPAGVQQGWVLVATASTRGSTTFTPPVGWIPIATVDSPTRQVTLRSWYHVAGPNEPASYTFTDNPQHETSIGIVAYSGIRAANPIDGSASASGKSATATAPTATASFDTHRIVAVGFNSKNTIVFSGATASWQKATGGGAGAAADAAQLAGTTDATTATQANVEWAIQTIVLNGAL
jgi:hypothetical protein